MPDTELKGPHIAQTIVQIMTYNIFNQISSNTCGQP